VDFGASDVPLTDAQLAKAPTLVHIPTMSPPPGGTGLPGGVDTHGAKMRVESLRAWFGTSQALKGITLPVKDRQVTAIIGPSGCGKSTFIRCLNRMHEIVAGAPVEGRVLLDGEDIYGSGVDPVRVRRRVGPVSISAAGRSRAARSSASRTSRAVPKSSCWDRPS
jgi:ABC-type multidrug transport system fused ATPase/permease subunit